MLSKYKNAKSHVSCRLWSLFRVREQKQSQNNTITLVCMCVCIEGMFMPAVILPLNQPAGAETDTKTHSHTNTQQPVYHKFFPSLCTVSELAKSKTSVHENHTEAVFDASCCFNHKLAVMDFSISLSSKQRLLLSFSLEDLDTFFSLCWSD